MIVFNSYVIFLPESGTEKLGGPLLLKQKHGQVLNLSSINSLFKNCFRNAELAYFVLIALLGK